MNVRFFNLSAFSVWSIYIVILGLLKLFFKHRYHGNRFKFNHILTSIEYSRRLLLAGYTNEAVLTVKYFGTVLVPGALFRKLLHIILSFCTLTIP